MIRRVEFEIEQPDDVPNDVFEAYIKFCLNVTATMPSHDSLEIEFERVSNVTIY